MKSVTVITPSTGNKFLYDAILSVASQDYIGDTTHLIVADGPEFLDDCLFTKSKAESRIPVFSFTNTIITQTPFNTGKAGGDFYGHRIYAAYPHLINSDYVAFLDEDNTYEACHLSSMINTLEKNNWDWIHSLRAIINQDGENYNADCCESLGRYPTWVSLSRGQQEYLIDTSTYLFKREFITQVASHWHSGWGGDRRFLNIIWKGLRHENWGCSGKYTLNYRLDANPEKKYGSKNFFVDGNNFMLKHYHKQGKYEWEMP